MPTILFVCTVNRYRSPIAAACFRKILLEKKLGSVWNVKSAGTWTEDGLPAIQRAVEEARQFGLDLRDHRSRAISEQILREADLVLTMEQSQKEALQIEFPAFKARIHQLREIVSGESSDILDPMFNSTQKNIIPELITLLETGFDQILASAQRD